MAEIAPGIPVIITDAYGTEHPAIATSGITKSHARGFPIVWVIGDLFRDDNPVPWPAEDVRAFDAGRVPESGNEPSDRHTGPRSRPPAMDGDGMP